MSKILKRPMFRIGGSANDGIMSMAAPRKNYQEGSEYIKKRDELLPLYQEAMGPGRSERNRLMDLLLEGSLALGAGAGAGKNLPQALALSFKEPAQRYIKSGQEEEAAQRQLKLAATTGAISAVDARRLAKEKEEAAFKLATLKSGTSTADKVEALTVKYLPDYQNDLNRAKNKATFDLVTRDQIANKFGQTQIGGIMDIDFTDPQKVQQFIRSNKNKVNKIFYDLNTGQAKQLQQDANGNFGFVEIDLTSNVVDKPVASPSVSKKEDSDAAARAYRKMISDELLKKRIEREGAMKIPDADRYSP
jgi:hypothetical protein